MVSAADRQGCGDTQMPAAVGCRPFSLGDSGQISSVNQWERAPVAEGRHPSLSVCARHVCSGTAR